MDEVLARDHLELRAILEMLFNDASDGRRWIQEHRVDYVLYSSAAAFGQHSPAAAERRKFLDDKRQQVEQILLLRDHAELQRILFPQIVHCFDAPAVVRRQSHDFNYYCSPEYFAAQYPTAARRRAYLDLRRSDWKEKQTALRQESKKFLRAVKKLRLDLSPKDWRDRVAGEPESIPDIER